MFDELKKSIQSILYERISSPLSGAFAISWIVWNWKFFYYLLSGDEKLNIKDRFLYIDSNLLSGPQLVFYPVVSAVLIICIYPLFSTAAYYVWIRMKTFQKNLKNEIEKNKMLTVSQSVELRVKYKELQDSFDDMVRDKEDTIDRLKKRVEELEVNYYNEEHEMMQEEKNITAWRTEYKAFTRNPSFAEFNKLIQKVNMAYSLDGTDEKTISYAIANSLIRRSNKSSSLFEWTDKGKYFVKCYLESN